LNETKVAGSGRDAYPKMCLLSTRMSIHRAIVESVHEYVDEAMEIQAAGIPWIRLIFVSRPCVCFVGPSDISSDCAPVSGCVLAFDNYCTSLRKRRWRTKWRIPRSSRRHARISSTGFVAGTRRSGSGGEPIRLNEVGNVHIAVTLSRRSCQCDCIRLSVALGLRKRPDNRQQSPIF
jgi:hypothetical protein